MRQNKSHKSIGIHLLGQKCVLQSWLLLVAPVHGAPLYCGAGFVQDLELLCVPPPHETEHFPHEDQVVNLPSTKTKPTMK